ncbi:MAG: hypothetical protein Q8S27_20195 [Hoeflea sp.]|uniref:hypothetical protein n=1 Tax=Hoeflea sp. TaxID=1940281 RepID=UPI00273184F3|nr:hypothetical protein [Hoeflea sp.]MDP2119873.1 hypothetical protein [Hoeflea sp.]MDP3526900.1 hypothetical protein [Hoeflea sp.]
MNEPLFEPLFEIETWRGFWFYKFGSRYAGPFDRRDDAVAAANRDLSPLRACQALPLRASLAHAAPLSLPARVGSAVGHRN